MCAPAHTLTAQQQLTSQEITHSKQHIKTWFLQPAQLTTKCNESNLKQQASQQCRRKKEAHQKHQGCSEQRQEARDDRRALTHTASKATKSQSHDTCWSQRSQQQPQQSIRAAPHIKPATTWEGQHSRASNHSAECSNNVSAGVRKLAYIWSAKVRVCSLAGKLLVWSSDCTAPQVQKHLRLGLFVTFCMTACAPSHIGHLTGSI